MAARKLSLAISMLSTLATMTTHAEQETSLLLGASLRYDDNAARSEKNKQSDVRQDFNANLFFKDPGRYYELAAEYAAVHSRYREDSQDERTSLSGIGSLTLFNQKRTLGWLFRDDESETLQNSQLPDSTQNRQRRSIFTTGPTWGVDLTARNRLSLSSHYSLVRQDGDGLDSDRWQHSINWAQQVSQKTFISLDVAHNEVEAKNQSDIDYKQGDAYLGFERLINGGKFTVQAGYSRIDRDQAEEDTTAPFYRLSLTTESLGGDTYVEAQTKLTDRSIGDLGFRAESDLQGIDLDTLQSYETNTLDIVTQNQIVLIHKRKIFSNTSITLSLNFDEFDYENVDVTEERKSAFISWNTRLANNMELNAKLSKIDFSDSEFGIENEQETTKFNINLVKSFAKGFRGSCGLNFVDRRGDIAESYDSRQVQCGVSFELL